jgi:hypothetical protein
MREEPERARCGVTRLSVAACDVAGGEWPGHHIGEDHPRHPNPNPAIASRRLSRPLVAVDDTPDRATSPDPTAKRAKALRGAYR